jgi:hypothetical protein
MKIKSKILIAAIAILLFGCINMAPETIDENQGPSGCTPQFPEMKVTYNNYVKNVIARYCINCHQGGNSSGPGNFTTYNGVRLYTDFFALRVIQDRADMPQGNAPLPKSVRDSLNIWIRNCSPEN